MKQILPMQMTTTTIYWRAWGRLGAIAMAMLMLGVALPMDDAVAQQPQKLGKEQIGRHLDPRLRVCRAPGWQQGGTDGFRSKRPAYLHK